MEIARQRCVEWKEGSILNLSNLGLTSIPDFLPHNLECLFIYDNQKLNPPAHHHVFAELSRKNPLQMQ